MTRQELATKLKAAGVVEIKYADIDEQGAPKRPNMIRTFDGTPVADLQTTLTEAGFPVTVDGYFGSLTGAALRQFNSHYIGVQTDVFRVADHDGATDPTPEPENTIHPRSGFPDEHDVRAAEAEPAADADAGDEPTA